jgi:hypothetical protein
MQVVQPPPRERGDGVSLREPLRDVAVQVDPFESANVETRVSLFRFKGCVKPGAISHPKP